MPLKYKCFHVRIGINMECTLVKIEQSTKVIIALEMKLRGFLYQLQT